MTHIGAGCQYCFSPPTADTLNEVFAAGADYVSKPIVGPELVTRIFNRLERSRLLRNMAEIDALTEYSIAAS